MLLILLLADHDSNSQKLLQRPVNTDQAMLPLSNAFLQSSVKRSKKANRPKLPRRPNFFFFYMPIKIYNTDLLVTLLTEYLTTLQGRCHRVQNAMTTPWHHKELRRFTYELQKKKNSRHEKEAKNTTLCLKLDIR